VQRLHFAVQPGCLATQSVENGSAKHIYAFKPRMLQCLLSTAKKASAVEQLDQTASQRNVAESRIAPSLAHV
jgi:hypothetical protein